MTERFESAWLDVDLAAIRAYAEMTGDFNPIHIDADFAATTPFGRPIAHGTMALNLVLQAASSSLGTARISGAQVTARFVKPVFAGDRIRLEAVQNDRDGYDFGVRRADGTAVITGTLSLPS